MKQRILRRCICGSQVELVHTEQINRTSSNKWVVMVCGGCSASHAVYLFDVSYPASVSPKGWWWGGGLNQNHPVTSPCAEVKFVFSIYCEKFSRVLQVNLPWAQRYLLWISSLRFSSSPCLHGAISHSITVNFFLPQHWLPGSSCSWSSANRSTGVCSSVAIFPGPRAAICLVTSLFLQD